MVKDNFNQILHTPLINQAYPNTFLVVGMHARGKIKGLDLIEIWVSMWHHVGGVLAKWQHERNPT